MHVQTGYSYVKIILCSHLLFFAVWFSICVVVVVIVVVVVVIGVVVIVVDHMHCTNMGLGYDCPLV